MKKILTVALALGLLFTIAGTASAQTVVGPESFGYAFATDYNKWIAVSAGDIAVGAVVVTLRDPNMGQQITPSGRSFRPFATNASVLIDAGGANPETLTPSAVTCTAGGLTCSFSVTTSFAHTGNFTIQSGTFGLAEAYNACTSTAAAKGTVIVANGFGGTTSTITGFTGSASVMVEDVRNGTDIKYRSTGGAYTALNGALVAALTSVNEQQGFSVHTTVITLSATSVPVTDALAYAGIELYDFPEGRILILGATGTVQWAVTSTRASTINDSASLTWGLGTATASAATLATTMQDLLPVTTKVLSAATTALNTASTVPLAASTQFDGTATAKKAFLNASFATGTDIDGDGTMTATGTITIVWAFLGDY